MAEIIRIDRQPMPAARFIGKKYTEADKKHGYFLEQWQQWITEGWFRPLYGFWAHWQFEGSDVPCGLYRLKEGEPMQYWIGRFLPPEHEVPEGYASVDLPAGTLGVCWVRDKGLGIYGQQAACLAALDEAGASLVADAQGAFWFFERYEYPRSRNADEKGRLTLDYCFYIDG